MNSTSSIEIEKLSPEQRLDLIARLWDSLDADSVPLTPAQATEIDQRLARADSDLATSVPWEVLKAELGNRHR